jgi:ribosomal protein S18 acetylase RimI-like enzyme
MAVRRAVAGDLEALHAMRDALVQAAPARRRSAWRKALEGSGYGAWVAEVDGEPAGFIDLIVCSDVSHGGKIGLVNGPAVDERFRGRGLGENLLREAVRHCEEQDVIELHVWRDHDNAWAIGLFEKVGFVDRVLPLERPM